MVDGRETLQRGKESRQTWDGPNMSSGNMGHFNTNLHFIEPAPRLAPLVSTACPPARPQASPEPANFGRSPTTTTAKAAKAAPEGRRDVRDVRRRMRRSRALCALHP